MEEICH